jgi:phenylacetate-coenzyme A ligase PaaK-like adenylate-forming protein
MPVPFFYSHHDLDNLSETGARLSDVLRFLPDERSLDLFPYAPHLAFWQAAFGGFATGSLVLHTGGGKVAGTDGNLRALERMQPHNLMGVPGYLYHLLRQAGQRGMKITGVKTVVLGADTVPPGLKHKLRHLLRDLGSENVQVLGTYGFTEARMAFGECPTKDGTSSGYHLYPDLGIFEIVDPITGQVLALEADGELVFTPLVGRGTTVFRYRTGDLVEGGIRHGPCPHCGRTTPRISSKLSRASSVHSVHLKKVKGTLVNIEELGQLLAADPEVEEWQIELRKKDDDPLEVDVLVLWIAAKRGATPGDIEERLRRTIKSHTEITPNEVRFVALDILLDRVGMEREMKEKRFVDARPTETMPQRTAEKTT